MYSAHQEEDRICDASVTVRLKGIVDFEILSNHPVGAIGLNVGWTQSQLMQACASLWMVGFNIRGAHFVTQ
jgi:hypothetical protein